MAGQNDGKVDDFKISKNQFQHFLQTHKKVSVIIPESNKAIKGSYVMVDPAGRFFENTTGRHLYSKPINNIGVKQALSEVNYDFDKFVKRGGIYKWE